MGVQVDAMDTSVEMAKLATQFTGLPVKQQTLESITDIEIYDGFWACASLLHLPEALIPKGFTQFEIALKPVQGVWYMSFKYGSGEQEKDGRVFTDLHDERLKELLRHCLSLSMAEQWVTVYKRPERDERRLNVVVCKKF